MLQISTELTLRQVVPPRDNRFARSEVLLNDQSTGTLLDGHILEAAVRHDRGWVLFVTDDIPYEEALRIYGLDSRMKLVDSAKIGWPYATGSFAGLRLEPPCAVHFRFMREREWTLTLREKPRFAFPFWPDTRFVWRGFRWRRYFTLTHF